MSYYYCEHCKDYKKKYHDCDKKSKKCYDKYDGYYKKCDENHEEKPCVNVKIDCCCDDKKDNLVRESAFRAVNNTRQEIAANTFEKVLFQTEQFDLAGEYNPNTSTFSPSKDGVYIIIATLSISTELVNRSAAVGIRVNGVMITASDNDFFGSSFPFSNGVSVNTILRLNAGDQVEVVVTSTIPGFISSNNTDPNFVVSTHFEAARFPSRSE
ncbi:C1q-like domain-containing protein [Bacillus sp. B3-WWTP-C-10-D-3]|uniref:C1q-like domain-containing protein n=1 Tax=Bacillus sp. B3-WWTP-C-10-D-3 TaxID=2653217 RepID=UPI0012614A4C|nr:hypothetical protein [Bacillus sp. B3-WWTP-C-10-D-3]KAB7635267.1 hypothetical protein GBN83_24835 [Bacillus sp. B3-WWTP-C-10-D-3]